MQTRPSPSLASRIFLATCGLIAASIGAMILATPATFHATNGIELGTDPSLLSEVRAPGGTLFALGLLILAGGVRPSWAQLSTAVSAVVYLAYGLSRVLSMVLDGVPDAGLVNAAAFELVLGAGCAAILASAHRRGNASKKAKNRLGAPSPT
ncbi:MAG: DUF4345 domain-containing protein [Planctomycetota bacterium]